MRNCGARLQKPGGQRKRGSVKHILEALSCLNSGTSRSSARGMRSMAKSIQTGQTSLHECCPTGLASHTKVVLFYDLTSMGAGELGDAFISSNKFFNEMKAQFGFFGDVYHVGAYGERWVSWPAWVLDRNVHTRGIEDHVNSTGTTGQAIDALDELLNWISADGGGTITGTQNGGVTFDGSGDANETTVYYGDNQTSPTMPPVFSNTEELLVIGFEDEAHATPNKWAEIANYAAEEYGPNGNWNLGGYYDSLAPIQTVATDGSYLTTWQDVAASHTVQVATMAQLGGAMSLVHNPQNVALYTDHSGDTANHTYDVSFWGNYGIGGVVQTNTCSTQTDTGNTHDPQSHWSWMSANNPNVTIGNFMFVNNNGTQECINHPTCCCDNGNCYNKITAWQINANGGAALSPSFTTVSQGITWLNANTAGNNFSAGMTLSAMMVAVNNSSLCNGLANAGQQGGSCASVALSMIMCECTSTQANTDGCVPNKATNANEYKYTFKSTATSTTGTMLKYRQTQQGVPATNDGTPTVLFQHDYCVAKKVINSHLGNIRYFLYAVPPVANSRVTTQVIFPLHVIGAMENGPLGAAPLGASCNLAAATTSGPYDVSGFNNMKAWGAGFGYNIVDLPCTSTQFSVDIQAYLNL